MIVSFAKVVCDGMTTALAARRPCAVTVRALAAQGAKAAFLLASKC